VAWARFPTPVVPEPPAVLAAQPLAGWAQQGPVEVSGLPAALVLREQLVLPVLGELAVQLVRPGPRALQAR